MHKQNKNLEMADDILNNIEFIDTSESDVSIFEKLGEDVTTNTDTEKKEKESDVPDKVIPKVIDDSNTIKNDDIKSENNGDNIFTPYAQSLKAEGALPDSFDENGATLNSIKDALYENVYKPLTETAEHDAEEYKNNLFRDKGLDEESLKVAQLYISGVDPRFMDALYSLNAMSSLQIEDNGEIDEEVLLSNRRKVIRAKMILNGKNSEEIDSYLEYVFDNDKDEAEAKLAKKEIETEKANIINKKEKEKQERIDNDKKTTEKLVTSYKDEIKNGTWSVDSKQFEKDLFEPTEYLSIKKEDGKTFTSKVPKMAKIFYEKNIRIMPLNNTKEGIASYIKTIHDLLYGEKPIDKSKKEEIDPIKSFVNGGNKRFIVDNKYEDDFEIDFTEINR